MEENREISVSSNFQELSQHPESGSALVYILIAIALLGALTVTFMEPSSQQTTSQNTFKMTSDLKSQADFIQTAVQECVLFYPRGDDTIPDAPTEVEEGYNHPFPLAPDSTHFGGSATTGPLVKDLRCPGNPGNNSDHASIFTGSSGKFMPPAPDLFSDWKWYNSADGVFTWIETSYSDSHLLSAMQKLEAEQYAPCEADLIDATAAAVDMDSNTPDRAVCPPGSRCLRIWFKRNTACP